MCLLKWLFPKHNFIRINQSLHHLIPSKDKDDQEIIVLELKYWDIKILHFYDDLSCQIKNYDPVLHNNPSNEILYPSNTVANCTLIGWNIV